jgi:hypothetical protein
MMEQHITRVSEAREEAVGSGCDHGPSVALVNPLQLLMAWVWPVPPALFTRCDAHQRPIRFPQGKGSIKPFKILIV